MAFIALFAMTFASCSSSDEAQNEQGNCNYISINDLFGAI